MQQQEGPSRQGVSHMPRRATSGEPPSQARAGGLGLPVSKEEGVVDAQQDQAGGSLRP